MVQDDLSAITCAALDLLNDCCDFFVTAEAGNGVKVIRLDDEALDKILENVKTKPYPTTGKKKNSVCNVTSEPKDKCKDAEKRYGELVSEACLDRLIDCKDLLEITVGNMATLTEQKIFPVERERFYANFNRLLNVQRDIEALIKDWR